MAILNIVAELGPVVLHTFVIYVFLTVAMSLLGHRQTSELGIVELVVIAMLGSAVETALIAGDVSLQAGLASVATLLLTNRLMSELLQHSPWLRRLLVGRPISLVYNGQILPECLLRTGLTEDDIRAGVREQGYAGIEEVQLAVLETDGRISVIPKEKPQGDSPGPT